MARKGNGSGAVFDVKKVDGVSRGPGHARRPAIRDTDAPRPYEPISDRLVQDLLRSIASGEPEHVRLAARRQDTDQLFGAGPGTSAPLRARRSVWPVIPRTFLPRVSIWSLVPWFIGACIVVGGLLFVSERGIRIKKEAAHDGQAAVEHLLRARDAMARFDFSAASDGFSAAREQFRQAGDDLGMFNTRLGAILAELPGGGRIDAARRFIGAGEQLAMAGSTLGDLVSAVAESGSILDPANDGRASFTSVLLPMQEALTGAARSLSEARELLAGVDVRDVPDEQQERFRQLVGELPDLLAQVYRGASYARFLEQAIAPHGNRSYLILFQNSSELRPTGGFPGSYGIAIFTDGRLLSLQADDVYNPDGQIGERIVPPRALQHITPGWGLRDSTWFADFPVSARKAMEMYEEGSGRRVDGVLAVTPEVIRGLLEISGPVSLPEYDLVLSADDFLPKLQAQVEYGLDKKENQPKKVVIELVPIILRKLYQAPKGEWLKVLSVFSESLVHRDIMMYFSDAQLQQFVADEGFDGRIHQGDEDYLMVNVSNVKGGKADAVTDTDLKLRSELTPDGVEHELAITRRHGGGTSPYGFHNLTNPAYVRVLVPKGSSLTGISGNTKQGFHALVRYDDAVFDADLDELESSAVYDAEKDVSVYQESGKTEFGFWLIVPPGQAREVRLKWTTPPEYADRDYKLYVQRQPGLDVSELQWEVSGGSGARLTSSTPALVPVGDVWRLKDGLDVDLSVRAEFR